MPLATSPLATANNVAFYETLSDTRLGVDSANFESSTLLSDTRIGVDSNAFTTYAINGGLVLGEVYRTTDSYGTTLQELTLGLNSYVVWAVGSTRYLYLKG